MTDHDERPTTMIIEKGGNGPGWAIVALLFLAVLMVGAYLMISNDNRETDAITGAARQVGDAAQQVGDAAKGADD